MHRDFHPRRGGGVCRGAEGRRRRPPAGRHYRDLPGDQLRAPPAKIGDGPILRVGDRSSIFDSAATATLAHIAADEKIPVQRCLMPGGTCEATAYQLSGYRSAALCVALGNYHNCGPKNQIAPEYVSLADVQGLVRLCTAIATSRAKRTQATKALKKRLKQNAERYKKLLKKWL